ncbi:MAG: hypothetical protein Q8J74_08105, partial [Candidatus Didemnitutus sp.]|nr:hypothetical protein [Candidatus Didemnitutus sp.]
MVFNFFGNYQWAFLAQISFSAGLPDVLARETFLSSRVTDEDTLKLAAALQLLTNNPAKLLRHVVNTYREADDVTWEALTEEYLARKTRGPSQQRHLRSALASFGRTLSPEKSAAVTLIAEE